MQFVTRIFKSLFPKEEVVAPTAKRPVETPADGPETQLGYNEPKMNLQERMAWRLDKLHKSIRITFLKMMVTNNMFRVKVTRLDERGHQFLVMIDVNEKFTVDDDSDVTSFAEIEEALIYNAFREYGIVIKDVYWRRDDRIDVFNRSHNTSRPSAMANVKSGHVEFVDTLPASIFPERRVEPRDNYEPISESEQEAFKAALQAGRKPPPVHIGNKTYDTDMMPLGKD